MKQGLTFIAMLLDRSGSMQAIHDSVLKSVNEFIEGQKPVPGECKFTLVQFDSENPYETVFHWVPIKEIAQFKKFEPRGGTPLHDAIGGLIEATGNYLNLTNEKDRPEKVVIVIMTDGLENASKKFSQKQIASMIEHQRSVYKWEFVFLAANQDAILTGEQLNIAAGATMTFAATAPGTANAMQSTTMSVNNYRMGKTASVSYTTEDRKAALEEDDSKAKITN